MEVRGEAGSYLKQTISLDQLEKVSIPHISFSLRLVWQQAIFKKVQELSLKKTLQKPFLWKWASFSYQWHLASFWDRGLHQSEMTNWRFIFWNIEAAEEASN